MAEESNIKNNINFTALGMNLETSLAQQKQGVVTYSLNATIEGFDGQYLSYQNESGNDLCVTFPDGYSVIGRYPIYESNLIIYWLTNPNTGDDEIGYSFIDECKYFTKAKADCFNFSIEHPILQAAHRSSTCGLEIFWVDGYNSDRHLEWDNLPYIEIDNGSTCGNIVTDQIDCNKLKLNPNFSIPEIEIIEVDTDGEIKSGVVQFAIQYANANGEGYTSYYSVTNPVPLHDSSFITLDFNTVINKSITLLVKNIDVTGFYDYFNLAVIHTVNGVTTPYLVNTYQINDTQERIIYTGQNKTQISLNLTEIIQKFPIYDKSNIITAVNDILIRGNLKTTKRISYQSIANQIKLEWQTRRLPKTETYANPLNVNKYKSYLRDEIYAFEIVFLLNNGLQTDGFHIPGRQSLPQDIEIISNNDTNNEPVPKWKVYNTASTSGFYPEWQNSTQTNEYNGQYQYGEFSYWENEEEYSCDEYWGELKNQKIRHHKFPDSLITHIHDNSGNIYPIGVKLDIQQIKSLIANSSLTQEEKDNIQGFKIVRGNRANNKSISGKGILTNVLKYSKDGNPIDNSTTSTVKTPKERALDLIQRAKTNLDRGVNNVPAPDFVLAKPITDNTINSLNNAALLDLDSSAYLINITSALNSTTTLVNNFYNDVANTYYSAAQQIIESLRDIRNNSTNVPGEVENRNNFYYFPNYLYNDVTGADPLIDNIIIDEDSKSRFTFQSPDTSFNQPFLGTSLKLETVEYGTANLNIVQVEKHAKYQFITVEAYTTAALTGLAVGFASGAYGLTVQVFDGTAAFTTYALIKDIIEKVTPRKNPCHQLNSTCEFTKFKPILNTGNKVRHNDIKNYIISGFPDLGDKYKINNWNREKSVYLKTNLSLPYTNEVYPELVDRSKFLQETFSEYSTQACVYYASLKKPFVSQYGPMYSYETIDTGFQYKLNTEETVTNIFGGDIFINKFAYKTKLPLFIDDRVNASDESDVFYTELQNVGNPKYWFTTDANQENTIFGSIFGVRPTSFYWRNKKFFNDYGLIFLYVYGIPYFYCESEINVDERQAFNTFEGDFYPRMGKGIPNSWLQQSTTPIIFDNTFYYNKTYSKQNKENVFTHLPLGFTDKECETVLPYRAVFSQAQSDNPIANRANPWLIYKPSSYFDFPQNMGKLTSLDGIENRQVLARFENKTLLYNALLTAPTSQAQVYLGQTLFNSSVPPIDYSNTDMGYVGSRHKFLLKTEYGIITVDDKRGHVFLLQGQQAKNLTDLQSGVEQFFNKNLEVKLPNYFPQLTIDNHYNFVGIHGVYDAKYNRLILTKLDYEPLSNQISYENGKFLLNGNQISLLNDEYFKNKSFTISYDFDLQSWISFHSYLPNYYVGSSNFFISGIPGSNWKHLMNVQKYNNFYDKIEPYIVESPTAYKYQDEILQNVKDYSKVYTYNSDEEFVETNEYYYNKLILYNNQQCSGVLELQPKPLRNMQAYMKYPYYNPDSKTITFTKSDNFYQVNTFWSLIKDRKKPIFLKTTPNLSIDKVLNQNNMDYSKRSFKKEPLRAKDLRCRFILDDRDDVKIVSQFLVNTTQTSYK